MELFEILKIIYKVWLFFACVLQTFHSSKCANSSFIGDTEKNIHIWSSDKYLNSSGTLVVKAGSSLVINCTIDLTINSSNISIFLNTSSQFSVRQFNDTFIQCEIKTVTLKLNGTVFWCGYRQRMNGTISQYAKDVTIIVGDTPSPPRSPTYTIHDVTLFVIKITWKPAIYIGYLPANYEVKYAPCYNESYCPDNKVKYSFCHTPHVNEQKEFNCEMKRDELMIYLRVDSFSDIFRFSLVTVNDVGKSNVTSLIVNAGFGGEAIFMPTPLPPKGLHGVALNSHQIMVKWQPKKYTTPLYDISYVVLYHAEEARHNKTKELKDTDSLALVDGIMAYTKYLIYLMVKVTSGNKSAISETVGPVNVMTSEGEPKQGPPITRQESAVFPNDHNIRNVTLFWKPPPDSSWQGIPSNMIIHYRETGDNKVSHKKVIPITDNVVPQNNTTLTGLKSATSYVTYLMLCNNYDCGSMGPEATIEPIKKDLSIVYDNSKVAAVAMGISEGLVVLFISVALITYFWKRRKRERLVVVVPLDDLVPQEQVVPDYVGTYSESSNPTESNYTRPDYCSQKVA